MPPAEAGEGNWYPDVAVSDGKGTHTWEMFKAGKVTFGCELTQGGTDGLRKPLVPVVLMLSMCGCITGFITEGFAVCASEGSVIVKHMALSVMPSVNEPVD